MLASLLSYVPPHHHCHSSKWPWLPTFRTPEAAEPSLRGISQASTTLFAGLWTHYIAEDDFKIWILLFLLLECWDHRRVPPQQLRTFLLLLLFFVCLFVLLLQRTWVWTLPSSCLRLLSAEIKSIGHHDTWRVVLSDEHLTRFRLLMLKIHISGSWRRVKN